MAKRDFGLRFGRYCFGSSCLSSSCLGVPRFGPSSLGAFRLSLDSHPLGSSRFITESELELGSKAQRGAGPRIVGTSISWGGSWDVSWSVSWGVSFGDS